MTSLHVICGLGPPKSKILATPISGTPLIKSENVDTDNIKNFRPVIDLLFLDKIIKKCVFQLVGQRTFANISIGYAQAMYYLSLSGLECILARGGVLEDVLGLGLGGQVLGLEASSP